MLKIKLVVISTAAALLFVTVVILHVFNPFNMSISPLRELDGDEPAGRRLEIVFSYDKLLMVASNQYAFWIEDMDGNYINTLYVTRYTAQEGYRRRPKSIPAWVAAAKPSDMRPPEIDAISGATPKPGDFRVYWDFTDRKGNAVTGSQYRYFIEATLYNDDGVLYTGVITLGDEAWEDTPVPEYSVPDSEYKAMFAGVRVKYYPD